MMERNEKKHKKNMLIPLLFLVLAGTALWFFYQEKVNVVEVVPVSVLRDDWWKDYAMCTGTVTNRMTQEVWSTDGKKMDDLFVEAGQEVKIGDVLLTFDMEEEKIELELLENKVRETQYDITMGNYTDRKEKEHELKEVTLEYETLKKTVDDATIFASIDGIVKEIDPDGAEKGTPVLVVASEDKLYVEGVIDEFSFANVTAGSLITAVSWDTGITFQAKITEISTYPVSQDEYKAEDSQNPNVSYYPFAAVVVGTAAEVEAGESVNIGFDGISNRLFLPLAYLRSEGSRSYVYMRGSSGRLKKQYVTTGQSLYNTVIEIKDGLANDDYVAFPYGSNIREGANTVISEDTSGIVY